MVDCPNTACLQESLKRLFGGFATGREHAERDATTTLDEREARDIGEAVTHIDHVLKRHRPRLFRNQLIHEVWLAGTIYWSNTLVDFKEEARLLGEGYTAFDFVDDTRGRVFAKLASVDPTELSFDVGTPLDHHLKATRDDVELDRDTRCCRAIVRRSSKSSGAPGNQVASSERPNSRKRWLVRPASRPAAISRISRFR
jgi:hypothetical protein